MIIPVDYSYTEAYLPTPRCRKLRYRDVDDIYEAEIKEVKNEDLKCVMRYQTYVFGEKVSIRRWIEIYQYDGRLWKISMEDCRAKDFGKLNDEHYIAWRIRAHNDGFEDKETMCEKMQKTADNIICCNGVFLETACEPVYGIFTFGLGHNHAETALMIESHGYNLNLPSSRYFNALQRDEAIEEAKRIALARGDTNSICSIENADMIEVFDKDAVKEDPQNMSWSGDDFLNRLEAITEAAPDSMSAGFLTIAATAKGNV